MKLSVFGQNVIVNKSMAESLERDGHTIFYNQFYPDIDVLLSDSISHMYDVYKNLKIIKKNKIKLINFILDIPTWRLDKNYSQNSILKNFRQNLYNITHKNQFLSNIINTIKPNSEKSKIVNLFPEITTKIFNTYATNQTTYLKNYRKLLKYSDLNLSISKFTKKLAQSYLKIDSEVCYPSVDSNFLLSIPKSKIKYDAINISRIVPYKRQELFVEAANKLGLKVLVIGRHQDKNIKLECPHYFLSDHNEVMKILNQAAFYVDASTFEGFGVTPVEAAFLDKIIVASDVYIHKEILGDYPLYFRKNNFNDLVNKMKIVKNGEFSINKNALNTIKKKYSVQEGKKRLLKFIESII